MWQLLLASLIWAFSYSLNKQALTGTNPFLVSCIFCVVSVIIFLPACMRYKFSYKNFIKILLLGALEFGLMYIFFQLSFLFLGAYEIALLLITTPIYVVLIDGILNRSTLAWPCFLASVCILLSFVLFSEANYSFNRYGVLLVQCSNLSFACGQVLVKKFFNKHVELSLKQSMSILYLGGCCVCGILAVLSATNNYCPLTIHSLFWACFLGVTCCGICHYLWNTGVLLVNTPVVAIMNNLQIPLSILVATLVFGEAINWYKICTCIIMLVFIFFVFWFYKYKNS